jgi:hypothetical protein
MWLSTTTERRRQRSRFTRWCRELGLADFGERHVKSRPEFYRRRLSGNLSIVWVRRPRPRRNGEVLVQVLVAFESGFLFLSLKGNLLCMLGSRQPVWHQLSLSTMRGGIVAGIVAAVPGFAACGERSVEAQVDRCDRLSFYTGDLGAIERRKWPLFRRNTFSREALALPVGTGHR